MKKGGRKDHPYKGRLVGEDSAHEPDPTGYQHDLLTMPANTLVVDTSGDLDWYKLGQHFARLNQQDPHEWGQGASDMVITLANKEQVERVKAILDRFGAEYKEIGGTDVHPEIHSDSAVKVDELKIQTPHPKDTLGVPRRHMPQIDEDHYKELFKYLFSKGVKVKKVTVDARDLDSTQSEFSDKGIEKSMTNGKMNKPIIISSDNYVLDGHHRWLAAKNGRKHEMTAFQVSVPAKEGLSFLINFPKTTFKDIHEEVETGQDAYSFAKHLEQKYDLQDLWLSDLGSRNAIELSSIIVKRDNQKSGVGSAVMNEIVKFADQQGKILVLDPAIRDKKHGTTSQSRLRQFYKKFGFIENKGRNKNYEFRHIMIRYPSKMNECAGVGRIVKGVNTTVDIGPNEIINQVKKFGNDVDRDGKPKLNLK